MNELTLIDFDSVPDIYINLLCAEILNSKDNPILEADGHSEFVITLSGNTFFEMISGDAQIINKPSAAYTAYSAYTVLPLIKKQKYKFMVRDNEGELIHLKFDMYAMCDSRESPSEIIRTYKPMLFKAYTFNVPEHDSIDRLKTMLESDTISEDLLRRQVESLIITLMMSNFTAIDTVMHALSAVALTADFPIEITNFKLSVSNIRLWSDNPETNYEAKLLHTNYAKHKYVEIPRKADNYRFEYTENSEEISDSFCELSLINSNRLKLWLFPNKNPLYLSKYKHKATITLKLKCSAAAYIDLHLYSMHNYCCFSYSLTVEEPNVWQSFTIPLINNSFSKNFHPLVSKAINYIKENYGSKITINDIAEELHIHPSYLSSLFKKNTAKSVNSYINFYRINIAKQMLINTDRDIASIALRTGFYDSQHFLKTFKKICGTTPSAFRKNNRT